METRFDIMECPSQAVMRGMGEIRRNGTMILWTRQVTAVWDTLESEGVYTVKKEYIEKKNDTISEYYLDLYKWYTKEAGKYIALTPGQEYPVWLCLKEETMLQPVEKTVILKLEVPSDKVLLCNMDAWGYRVNYWYIPLDDEDEKRHGQEMKRYGIVSDDQLISTNKGNFYPLLRRKIVDSWERVFTLAPDAPEKVAATIWEIRREWVREVRLYDGAE